MKWIIPVAQEIAGMTLAIDSSDPATILAGLEVYDMTESRPAINSVNLEEGRHEFIGLAKDHKPLLLLSQKIYHWRRKSNFAVWRVIVLLMLGTKYS